MIANTIWIFVSIQKYAQTCHFISEHYRNAERECCRQVQAEVVGKSRNKSHQTCPRPFSWALYTAILESVNNHTDLKLSYQSMHAPQMPFGVLYGIRPPLSNFLGQTMNGSKANICKRAAKLHPAIHCCPWGSLLTPSLFVAWARLCLFQASVT